MPIDLASFLPAIAAAPDDDAPRLVLADALMEQGEGLGELIAVQCRLAAASGPERAALTARAKDLSVHADAQLEALGLARGEGSLDRGVLGGLHMSAARLLEVERGLLGRSLVRRVVLVDPDVESLRVALRSPLLAAMSELVVLGDEVGDGAAEVIAGAPLQALRKLRFSDTHLGDAGAEALSSSPSLAGLRDLDLYQSYDLGPAGAQAIARSPYLGQLSRLCLGGNRLGDDGGVAIAASRSLGALRILDLGACELTAATARALAASSGLGALSQLTLFQNDLGVEGATALAGATGLSSLRELSVWSTRIGPSGFLALACSERLAGLVDLNAASSRIAGDAMNGLVDAPTFGRWTHLRLHGKSLGDRGAVALARGRSERLELLWLSGAGVGDRGVVALAASPLLSTVKDLDLGRNPIGDAGVRALAASPYLDAIERLEMTHDSSEGPAPDLEPLLARFGSRLER